MVGNQGPAPVPLPSKREQREALYAWSGAWNRRFYGTDPLNRERQHYWLPTPHGSRVAFSVPRAADIVGDLFDEILAKIESGKCAGKSPDEIMKTANWLLPRRVVDAIQRDEREPLSEPQADEIREGQRCDARNPEEEAIVNLDARRAIAVLEPADRRSLGLDLLQLDGQSQARILGTSEACARKRLSRARRRLREAA